MAVYREGFEILESLQKQSQQINPATADWGVPLKVRDKNWYQVKQLVDTYQIKGTRTGLLNRPKSLLGTSIQVELIDEWAVSDKRLTLDKATSIYRIDYVQIDKIKDPRNKWDAFITLTKIK